MKQPNFITLLKDLKQKEITGFQQYLLAFFPADSIPVQVFTFLLDGKLDTQLVAIKEEDKLIEIFPDNKNTAKSLSNTFSDLQKALEEFLVLAKLKKKSPLYDQLLLEVFQERKLETFADSLFMKHEKAIEKKQHKTAADYLFAMQWYEAHFYTSRTPKLDSNTGIEKCMRYLDLYFAASKFRIEAELRNRKTFINDDKGKEGYFLHALEEFWSENKPAHTPTGTLFYLAYKLNEKADPQIYHILKKTFFKHLNQLSKLDKNIIMSYLLNYTARDIRKGNAQEILEESFDLHKLGVEKKLFISDNYFSPARFTNIVELACKVKKFAWALSFISKYKGYLPKDIQDAVVLVCYGIINFKKGDFANVLTNLALFGHKDVFLNIRVKLLTIQALYESKEDISAQCHSFEVYLSRKKIAHADLIRSCKNFIKFVRKLSYSNAAKNKNNLLENLEQTDKIAYKIWLSEKIQQL